MASGKSAEFSPAELDRIEDAIELVESGDLPEDLTPEMRARLLDYRRILQLSREALPLEEVPDGALDGVLEEARLAATAPAVKTDAGAEPTGVFRRLGRAFLVPTLALAGTAALVLWMVRPKEEATSDVLAAAPEAELEPMELAEKDAAQAFPGLGRERAGEAGRLADAEAAAEEEPVAGLGQQAETTRGLGVLPKQEKRDESSGSRSTETAKPRPGRKAKKSADKGFGDEPRADDPFGAGPQKKPPSAPAPKPANGKPSADPADPAAEGLALAERGDRFRRQGRCDLARVAYKNALGAVSSLPRGGAGSANEARAHAHAGIGLCDEWEGDQEAAAARFARARKVWAGIEAFIRNERSLGYRGGASSKRAKSKQNAAPKAAEDAYEQ